MIALLQERLPDGDLVHIGMVQVADHQGIPVLEPARWLSGHAREKISLALNDVYRARKTSKRRFPPVETTIVLQRSKPPGRTVYSGLVKVDVYAHVPVFGRVIGDTFPWFEDVSVAIDSARGKESG